WAYSRNAATSGVYTSSPCCFMNSASSASLLRCSCALHSMSSFAAPCTFSCCSGDILSHAALEIVRRSKPTRCDVSTIMVHDLVELEGLDVRQRIVLTVDRTGLQPGVYLGHCHRS